MTEPTEPRKRGRPRTRPAGTRKRTVHTTDAEHGRVHERAAAAGVSAEEWMRRAVLKAAGVKA